MCIPRYSAITDWLHSWCVCIVYYGNMDDVYRQWCGVQRASDSKARGVIGNGHIFIVQCTMCAYVSRCDHVAKQRVGIKNTVHVARIGRNVDTERCAWYSYISYWLRHFKSCTIKKLQGIQCIVTSECACSTCMLDMKDMYTWWLVPHRMAWAKMATEHDWIVYTWRVSTPVTHGIEWVYDLSTLCNWHVIIQTALALASYCQNTEPRKDGI